MKVQIVEGRFFEKPEEQHRTLTELMDRYSSEHAARRANYRRELTSVKNLKAFFGNPTLDQITPQADRGLQEPTLYRWGQTRHDQSGTRHA